MYKQFSIVPRWIIFCFDLCITSFSFTLACLVKQNLSFTSLAWNNVLTQLLILLFINGVVFAAVKTYSGIIRHTGFQDMFKVLASVCISGSVLFVFDHLNYTALPTNKFSNVVLILYCTFSFLGLISYRVMVKFMFGYLRNFKMERKIVVIYGAGEAGIATKRVLENHSKNNVSILAFIDDNRNKINKIVDGIKIISSEEFIVEFSRKYQINELIIAVLQLPVERRNKIVDFCLDQDIKILNVPPLEQWVGDTFSAKQLKNIKIEQLLERDSITVNSTEIEQQIRHKRILVTGAAGSIGSEIVRQLLKFGPELIIICDQAETPLHHLQLELDRLPNICNFIPYLADITNFGRMNELFREYEPHLVYHAAAYKHVPMMEISPFEAIRNNVLGTKLLADLSVQYKIQRFVMISTDKAVNPTNVMGASKRMAEIYVQGLAELAVYQTKFITTRFGNVLGSNGSVINLFKEQIKQGGPVTVTHPKITRYFMTIPEACQLVLEAGAMGGGGEIFVFDMGKPVAIAELAKKMIRLYGLIPGIDIKVTYTGLRPGEKLYEELLNDEENTTHTYNQKIMIAKVRPVNMKKVKNIFVELESLIESSANEMEVVSKMKDLVPEFISNNSVYEQLDGGNAKVISISG